MKLSTEMSTQIGKIYTKDYLTRTQQTSSSLAKTAFDRTKMRLLSLAKFWISPDLYLNKMISIRLEDLRTRIWKMGLFERKSMWSQKIKTYTINLSQWRMTKVFSKLLKVQLRWKNLDFKNLLKSWFMMIHSLRRRIKFWLTLYDETHVNAGSVEADTSLTRETE